MRVAVSLMLLCSVVPQAFGHEYLSFDELAEAFGYDFENTEVRTEQVGPGVHALFGVGGNVVVSIVEQGVLMVDSQFSQMKPKLHDSV